MIKVSFYFSDSLNHLITCLVQKHKYIQEIIFIILFFLVIKTIKILQILQCIRSFDHNCIYKLCIYTVFLILCCNLYDP